MSSRAERGICFCLSSIRNNRCFAALSITVLLFRQPARCLLIILSPLAAGLLLLNGQTPVLPELPSINVANFFPAVSAQVQRAYDAAQANPKSAKASGGLGMALDAYEQYSAAAICYRRANLLDPAAFQWAYYLGLAQAALGRYEDAAVTLGEALKLNPDYVPAQLKLGESLLAVGKWEESGKNYRAVVKQHADCAEAYYGLGRIAAARGNPAEAIEWFRKACELFPAYGPSHYALAQVYRRIGQSQKSEEQLSLYKKYLLVVPPTTDPLRNAIEELNQSPLPHLRRGLAFEQAGKIKEAIAEHEKALEIDPGEVQAHANLISLYGRLGQVAKAEQHYREAVRLSPSRADAYYDYGVLLLGQKRSAEAQQAFEHALQINPCYAEAQNKLGTLLEQRGELEEARQQFQAALANRPDYRIARFHLARILVNQGNYNEAIQHFLKILAPEDEETPRYLYALAATYARAGDRESALNYMRKAHEGAASRRQSQLLTSIDKDLRTLEQGERQP